MRICFGCKQPFETIPPGEDDTPRIAKDWFGREWHQACYDTAADDFLSTVPTRPERHR
jgi:hypothetical protein